MGPIGWPELVLILVVVLVIFGPGKLPDVGNAIGRGIREFRKASNELEESVRGTPPRRTEPKPVTTSVEAPRQDTAETK